MINKSLTKTVTIITLNIIFVYLIAKWLWLHVEYRDLINEAALLDRTSIVLTVLLVVVLNFFYGFRMALLLNIRLIPSIQIVILGFGFNSFFPFRLGEMVKIFFAKLFFRVDLSKTAVATVIEKGMDLVVVASLAFVFLFWNLKSLVLILLCMVALIIIVFIIQYRGFSLYIFDNKFVNSILQLIKMTFEKNKARLILLFTVIIWVLTCFVFFLFFNSNIVGDESFGIFDGITLLVFTTLSVAIPSMPASIGLFESGIVYYLMQHFHFLAEKAVAYALIFHLITIFPQIVMTVIILLLNANYSRKSGASLSVS